MAIPTPITLTPEGLAYVHKKFVRALKKGGLKPPGKQAFKTALFVLTLDAPSDSPYDVANQVIDNYFELMDIIRE